MRTFPKILILLAALAALVACIAIIAVIALPGTDFVRNGVQDKLREVTGQEVSLGSIEISGSFPSLISVTVKDVALSSSDGKKVLSADSVVLIPELAPLLQREVSVESVTIRGLRTFMIRAADGTIQNVFIPVPVSSGNANLRPDARPEAQRSTRQDLEAGPGGGSGLRWSVDAIRLEDCRVDWIDHHVVSGRETVVPISHVNGSMKRVEPANSFSVKLNGRIGDQKEKSSPFVVDGVVSLSNDLSAVQRATVDISSDALNLDFVFAYLPAQAEALRQLGTVVASAGIEWEKGKSGRIAFRTESKEPLTAKASGEASFAPGFSAVERASATCVVKGFPLALVKHLVPEMLPFNVEMGTLTAALQGEGGGPQNWNVGGSLELRDVVPVGSLAKLAPRVHVSVKGDLDPARLVIDHFQIGDHTTLARIDGHVSQPLTEKRALDLKGEFLIEPQWLTSLGLQVPKEIHFNGPIPVHGSVKGRLASPFLDLKADISALGIEWLPYLDKAPGSKASVSMKGNPFSLAVHKQPDRPTISVRLQSARLGSPPHALTKASVQMDAAIQVTPNTVDLKDAVLTVKRASDGADVVTANASVSHIGASDLRFDGNASVTVNKELIVLAGLDSRAGVTVEGSSPLKVKFSGTPSVLQWSLELPLNDLDVSVREAFRKPGGVAGSCKAVGKWSGEILELTDGRLIIPGLTLHARGPVMDRTGKFREAVLDVKKLELTDLLRLTPSISRAGLSGHLAATIQLKNSGGQIVPSGKITVLGVDYRPPNAGLGVERVTGSLEPSGTSVAIPELKGKLTGAIEAPVKIKGSLAHVPDVSNLSGHIILQGGPGNIRAETLQRILKQVQLVGTLLGPLTNQKNADLMELRSLSADIDIKSGTATTENFRIAGPGLAAGAIGSIQLNKSDMDLTAAIQGATAVGTAIGKIPEVQKLVKRHEGLLKATGLDKELKRFGIGVPEGNTNGDPQNQAATPITVILKVRGPISGPQISPVLESGIDKGTLSRLKSLLE